MAIAYDAASSKTGSADVDSWAHTCSGSDRILVVGITTTGVASVQSVTYNGVSLTKIANAANGSTSADTQCELWYLVAPATGTHDVVVTLNPGSGHVYGATSWTGVDQSTPLGTAVTATGTGTTATVNASSAAGETVLDVVGNVAQASLTEGAGQTARWDTNTVWVYGAGSHEAGGATVTMSWTLGSSQKWAIVAVPIKPGTGGGGAGETTLQEVWVIPARTEPFAIADGYTGELARGLASIFPHLLAWRVEGARFIWHDLGWLPAQAQLEALGAADVPLGSGVDPGLILFGVEAHDGVVLTSLASSALGASQRRYPDPGGVAGTDSGVLYGSRMEFNEPHRLLAVRIWGEDFQQADTVRFAYRWDRKRWYSVGEIHGIPAPMTISDSEGGLFLEWVIGFTDVQAWEPNLPVITRVDAQVEAIEKALAPEPDVQVPEID